jgi:two-component system, LytTR family, response regulator
MIRTLVVDDEQPARDRLRRMLSGSPDVEIVGEAEDGEHALEVIQSTRPDLVLLDIQMPGCTGMEVAASLASPRPHLIFCTAFDQYAVEAFELHAIDYLLKPVSQARLDTALDRVRAGRGTDVAIDRAARSSPPTRFVAQRGRTYRVVPARDVLCFLSEDGLTKLQTAGEYYWVPPTLNDLELRVDPRRFFRISRSAIVNLDAVQEIVPTGDGRAQAVLKNGARLEVSRRRFRELTERLEG